MSKHTSHQQSIHPGGMMDLDCHFLLAVLINAQHPGQKCDHGSYSHPLRPPQGALAHLGPSFIFSPPELARKAEGHLTLIPPQKRPLREALHLPQVHHTGWWEDPCPLPSSRSHVLSKHFLWCPGRHCVVYSIEMLSYPSTPRANILPKKGMMSDFLRKNLHRLQTLCFHHWSLGNSGTSQRKKESKKVLWQQCLRTVPNTDTNHCSLEQMTNSYTILYLYLFLTQAPAPLLIAKHVLEG